MSKEAIPRFGTLLDSLFRHLPQLSIVNRAFALPLSKVTCLQNGLQIDYVAMIDNEECVAQTAHEALRRTMVTPIRALEAQHGVRGIEFDARTPPICSRPGSCQGPHHRQRQGSRPRSRRFRTLVGLRLHVGRVTVVDRDAIVTSNHKARTQGLLAPRGYR